MERGGSVCGEESGMWREGEGGGDSVCGREEKGVCGVIVCVEGRGTVFVG